MGSSNSGSKNMVGVGYGGGSWHRKSGLGQVGGLWLKRLGCSARRDYAKRMLRGEERMRSWWMGGWRRLRCLQALNAGASTMNATF